jgi:predicted O-methyltransferase YrrM
MTDFDRLARIPNANMADHGWVLYAFVREHRPQAVVEIGSWRGHSTCWLAAALRDNGIGHLWAIDCWSLSGCSKEGVEQTLVAEGLAGHVTLLDGVSHEILRSSSVPAQIGFAFIDGCHHYDCVKDDTEQLLQRLEPGGSIALHDAWSWWGSRDFILEMRQWPREQYDMMEFNSAEGVFIIRKRGTPPPVTYPRAAFSDGCVGACPCKEYHNG